MTDPDQDPAAPVLVGVGESFGAPVAERGGDHEPEPLDFMVAAALAALDDAVAGTGRTAGTLAARLGSVAVPVGNWSYADPAALVADRIGATDAATIRAEIGISQLTSVRIAAERIAAGDLDAALVVGGEAMATRLAVQRAGGTPRETDDAGAEPDERWSPEGEFMAPAEVEAGLWDPVVQYACIEAALGHAEGRTPDEHLDEIAALWERCNVVARDVPTAAFAEPRDAAFLRAPGPGNRPLAHPYAKWHSTQWAVDRGAALVLCSTRLADELDVPAHRRLHPRVLVESSHALSMSRRTELHRWPAMGVLGAAAETHLGAPLGELAHIELYSCFPSAVRVQQRELGLDPAGTPTLRGGMAFDGGPFNHASYHSVVEVARRIRAGGGAGLVTAVSGLLTKPALAVFSAEPGPALFADLADQAAAATGSVPSVATAHGVARVVTATAVPAGAAPAAAYVVAELDGDPDRTRWVGRVEDLDLIDAVLAGAVIGRRIRVEGTAATLVDRTA